MLNNENYQYFDINLYEKEGGKMSLLKNFYSNVLFPSDIIMSYKYKKLNKNPTLNVMDAAQTLDYIMKTNCSVARFGEGEFELIMWPERNLGFQDHDEELAIELERVLGSRENNLLICIPYALNDIKGRTKDSRTFWYYWAEKKDQRKRITDIIRKYHDDKDVFGDTQISRPYIAWPTTDNADKIFPKLKKLWAGKDIIIVEGEKTRLGVGNDLFDGAKSIKRILGPSTNAFKKRKIILEKVLEVHSNELIILALGPTATVLSYELSQAGVRAIDIGHVDIEYEWYLRKASKHDIIPGKFTNEAANGNNVAECEDEEYLNQIIARIE